MAPTSVPKDGIYVPSPTFFKPLDAASGNPHPAVDINTQAAHTVHQAKSGITGVVLMGSTGEAIHLTRQERSDLISGVRKGLDDAGFANYPIMAGVLINSTEEAAQWLENAEKAGAQWGLVLAPGYFGAQSSQEGIIEWFTIVADRSPIPILLTHADVSYHLEVSPHPKVDAANFRVFSGLGQQLGPIMLFNAAGA